MKWLLMVVGLIWFSGVQAFNPVELADSDLEGYPLEVQKALRTGVNHYNQEEFFKAFQELEPLAKKGVSAAQLLLGILYTKGKGVPRDFQQAYKWFAQAGRQGLPNAQYAAGQILFYGKGGKEQKKCTTIGHFLSFGGGSKNCIEAYAWFNLAASQEYKDSSEMLKQVAKVLTTKQLIEAQELSTKIFSRMKKPKFE